MVVPTLVYYPKPYGNTTRRMLLYLQEGRRVAVTAMNDANQSVSICSCCDRKKTSTPNEDFLEDVSEKVYSLDDEIVYIRVEVTPCPTDRLSF